MWYGVDLSLLDEDFLTGRFLTFCLLFDVKFHRWSRIWAAMRRTVPVNPLLLGSLFLSSSADLEPWAPRPHTSCP